MQDADELTRELDLLWLQSELAALPEDVPEDDPMTALRVTARRALLLAQAGGDKALDHAALERLNLALMVDRAYRSGGRRVCEMDDIRFRGALASHAGCPDPFGLRFDITRPGAALDDYEGPMQ